VREYREYISSLPLSQIAKEVFTPWIAEGLLGLCSASAKKHIDMFEEWGVDEHLSLRIKMTLTELVELCLWRRATMHSCSLFVVVVVCGAGRVCVVRECVPDTSGEWVERNIVLPWPPTTRDNLLLFDRLTFRWLDHLLKDRQANPQHTRKQFKWFLRRDDMGELDPEFFFYVRYYPHMPIHLNTSGKRCFSLVPPPGLCRPIPVRDGQSAATPEPPDDTVLDDAFMVGEFTTDYKALADKVALLAQDVRRLTKLIDEGRADDPPPRKSALPSSPPVSPIDTASPPLAESTPSDNASGGSAAAASPSSTLDAAPRSEDSTAPMSVSSASAVPAIRALSLSDASSKDSLSDDCSADSLSDSLPKASASPLLPLCPRVAFVIVALPDIRRCASGGWVELTAHDRRRLRIWFKRHARFNGLGKYLDRKRCQLVFVPTEPRRPDC